MHLAAEKGKILRLRQFLSGNLDVTNAHGDTALYLAASNGHLRCVTMLLEAKANVNTLSNSLTALMVASQYGHLDVVNALIQARASLNHVANGHSALHSACKHPENHPIVAALLAAGALVDAPGASSSPIVAAIAGGSIESLKLLIAAGADVNSAASPEPPISSSVVFSNIVSAKLLLDAKANVNLGVSSNAHPVALAVSVGDLEMVKLFIAAGADTAIRYFHNRTCLHVLSDLPDWTQKSYQPVSEENPNFAAKMYTNPHDYPGVFKALVDAKADISARVHNGDTPLCTAANRKNAEAVRALLAVGADPNYINDDDESALLIASRSGCLDAVTALIAARADVNCASRDSPTALYYACALRRVDIISALISAGADVNCISVNSTPLDLAIIHNNNAIIAILKDAGAVTWETLTLLTNPLFGEVHTAGTGTGADTDRRDPNRDFDPRLIPSVSDRDREDALRFAVATSNLPIAKHLLAAGVSPHIQLCSKSLLCAASVRGCTDIVRELLDAGADITVKDDDDMTALQWAAKGKHRDIVALLLAKAKELKNANKREDRRTE